MRFDGHEGGFFEGVERDGGAGGANGFDFAEFVTQEFAKRFGVPDANFDEITVFARHIVDLEDLRDARERLTYGLTAKRFFGLYKNERDETFVDFFGVKARFKSVDDARRFQLADAFKNGGLGQSDLVREGRVGDASVLLNDIQYFGINLVHYSIILPIF